MAREQRALTERQALEAAYRFVARYYRYFPEQRLFHLLISMDLTTADDAYKPQTGDPGMWGEWLQCVDATLNGEPEPPLPPPQD